MAAMVSGPIMPSTSSRGDGPPSVSGTWLSRDWTVSTSEKWLRAGGVPTAAVIVSAMTEDLRWVEASYRRERRTGLGEPSAARVRSQQRGWHPCAQVAVPLEHVLHWFLRNRTGEPLGRSAPKDASTADIPEHGRSGWAWIGAKTMRTQHKTGAPRVRPGLEVRFGRLGLFVLLDVPAHLAARLAGALLILFEVLDLELGEVDRHVLREQVAAVARLLHAGDEDVVECDLEVLDRLLAGLADGNQTVGDVLAVAAVQHQRRRGLVQELRDGDVVDVDLARPVAAARMASGCLIHPPAKGFDMNLVLVLVVLGFALDAIQLEEHVDCHGTNLP